ncbi:uncharacterized protein LAESUDRAFT_729622 [Laetiporus sulphureus 93-53]|uniref:Uncharacterized protein n=1 Tax=Laetiporus sulphureus 93-53 TaxID=1314785 RepID=A0A165CN33_9APHY|nr:uncharacterized protein LAESUDRAFT_729622 [Laetiporus sulphureus 93-53]KZT03111.1 hypothetical protein LAESUDRAFT_729622 [Laetiporus sulphureus 93-53]
MRQRRIRRANLAYINNAGDVPQAYPMQGSPYVQPNTNPGYLPGYTTQLPQYPQYPQYPAPAAHDGYDPRSGFAPAYQPPPKYTAPPGLPPSADKRASLA